MAFHFVNKGIGVQKIKSSEKPFKRIVLKFIFEKYSWASLVPSASMVKNLPANAGDIGSIPGPGRSQILQSN